MGLSQRLYPPKNKDMPEEIDYKLLLKKYIQHIKQCEGIDFIDYIDDGWRSSNVKFSEDEIKTLKELSLIWNEQPK